MINPGHTSFKSQDHEESIIVVAKKLTGKLGGGNWGDDSTPKGIPGKALGVGFSFQNPYKNSLSISNEPIIPKQ